MDTASLPRGKPDPRLRFAVVVVAALVTAVIATHSPLIQGGRGGDHYVLWSAARDVASGIDPYHVARTGALPALFSRFFYPLPAILLSAPFAWLPPTPAAISFAVVSAAILLFGMTADGLQRTSVLLSAPFVVAAAAAQATPVIVGLALLPALSAFALLKPSVGVPLLARSVSIKSVLVVGAVFLVSIAFFPEWPLDWMRTLGGTAVHQSPVFAGIGFVGLASAVRWRRGDARLLLMMTIIPHSLAFFDEIPLWLVAQTRQEAMLLTVTSWLGVVGSLSTGDHNLMRAGPWIAATIYFPATVMVLLRPNEGPAPGWIELMCCRWPSWIRGRPLSP